MSRFMTLALAGATALGTSIGAVQTVQAAPLPALSGSQVGGANTAVDHVGWRGGYYGGGYGYRGGYGGYRGYGYRRNVGGALAAGAALGLIGGAIAASTAPRYGYYGGYGGGYGGYGGYGYPSYGYAPVGYGYGYPAYGGYYGYGGW